MMLFSEPMFNKEADGLYVIEIGQSSDFDS